MELSKRERFPVVSLFGNAGVLTSVDNVKLPSEERLSTVGYMAGINLEVPIFNWGATDLRVQQRQVTADILQSQSLLLQRSILSETQKARLGLANARERLRLIRSSVKSAEDSFLLTKSKFAGGGTLSFEVLAAQQLLTDTKLEEV